MKFLKVKNNAAINFDRIVLFRKDITSSGRFFVRFNLSSNNGSKKDNRVSAKFRTEALITAYYNYIFTESSNSFVTELTPYLDLEDVEEYEEPINDEFAHSL